MIQKSFISKRELKKFTREVNLAEAAMTNVPDYIDWSEQAITFSRADHPKVVPRPGHASLVVQAQIGGYNMGKVFMDGGSALNILFESTLRAMNIAPESLAKSDTAFHGIIPTLPATPLGKISLDVIFGNEYNFRRERLEFEVVDWESQYHAILGRPAYAKFMIVPHYPYLMMKMPGNAGTPLTVHGSFTRSDNCDREFNRIAAKFGVKQEFAAIAETVDHSQPPADNRNARSDEVETSEQTKKLQVSPQDPKKTVNVAKDLPQA